MTRPSARFGEHRRARGAHGAAMIGALLIVALVSILAANAFWQQWRSTEQETSERTRLQASWLLAGTLDWARAALHQDGLRAGVDHLGEAWARPVRNIPLGEFLAAGRPSGSAGGAALPDAAVSLQITDMQSRMNVLNLLDGSQISSHWMAAFTKLFEALGLPAAQLSTLADNLRQASAAAASSEANSTAPLMPHDASQLTWLGLQSATLAALEPHISVLPGRVPVNLNTAGVEVLHASIPAFSRADAQKLVALRQAKPLLGAMDAGIAGTMDQGQYAVSSRYFLARSELKLGQLIVAEHALLQRDGPEVRTLRRQSATVSFSNPATPPR